MADPNITFYCTVEGRDQQRITNFSTIKWWLRQSPEAIKSATDRKQMKDISTALMEFAAWWKGHGFTHVWSNGSVFDVIIMENAFRQFHYEIPWSFWNIRDVRTITDIAYRITGKTLKPVREGTHHNALDDAQYQAQWIRDIRKIIEP